MATYLIDYENPAGKLFFKVAGNHYFPECNRITNYAKDVFKVLPCNSFMQTVKNECSCNNIILFYSDKNVNRSELTKCIQQSSISFKYAQETEKIKNGLDSQLDTYLGSIINNIESEFHDTIYFIVSEDKGYVPVIDFWKKNCDYSNTHLELVSTKDEMLKAFTRDELHKLFIHRIIYTPEHDSEVMDEDDEDQQDSMWDKIHDSMEIEDRIVDAFFDATSSKSLHTAILAIVNDSKLSKPIYRVMRPIFKRYQKMK